MSVTVRKSQSRRWPVTVRLNVSDDKGTVTQVEHVFVGHFKPFTEDAHAVILEEIDAMYELPEGQAVLPRATVLKRNAAYFGRLLDGWDGVADEDGAPIPFSAPALTEFVTGPDGFAVSEAIFMAISEIRFGEASLKNLLTSVAPGEQSRAAGATTEASTPTAQPSA